MSGRRRLQHLAVWAVLGVLAALGGTAAAADEQAVARGGPAAVGEPPLLMAYYYIWFDRRSWNRAKTDYPLLGRYSSDDRAVMERHADWAQTAGLDGLIVSWKSTPQLDPRLEQLMEVAADRGLALWIIYQGLDFHRDPLPAGRVADDLRYFIEHYASHPAFALLDRPVVIWSGTWKFSHGQVAKVRRAVGDRVYLLASERNIDGYRRLADLVDGNAYYWSSVDPSTDHRHRKRLAAMGRAVHEHGGLWVAPAAPGFDARLIGGKRVIERHGGATLRHQLDVAVASSPDAVGLISWNEFSENTHVEPSVNYGSEALEVVADWRGAEVPRISLFDSDTPVETTAGAAAPGPRYPLILLGGFLSLVLASVLAVCLRRRPTAAPDSR